MKDSFKLYSSHLLHGLEAIILFLITFYSPVALVFVAIGALQILDTLLGFLSAFKRGKAHSRPLRLGFISKFIVYFMIVALVFVFDYALMNELVLHWFDLPTYCCTKVVGIIFCAFEYKSINENTQTLTGKTLLGWLKWLVKGATLVVSSINDIKEGNYDKYKDDDTNSKSESES